MKMDFLKLIGWKEARETGNPHGHSVDKIGGFLTSGTYFIINIVSVLLSVRLHYDSGLLVG